MASGQLGAPTQEVGCANQVLPSLIRLWRMDVLISTTLKTSTFNFSQSTRMDNPCIESAPLLGKRCLLSEQEHAGPGFQPDQGLG